MRALALAAVLCSLVAFADDAAPAAPAGEKGAFKLDPEQTQLLVKTHKEGLVSGFAHNHVIRASAFSGEFSWDAARPEAASFKVEVKTSDLVVDEPKLRAKIGGDYAAEISEGDRAKITANMKADDQLDTAKFPTLSFASTQVRKSNSGVVVTGKLSIHGKTREVSFPAKFSGSDDAPVADANFTVKLSDYGITPYSTGLGTIKNKDEVDFAIHLVGKR